MNEWTQIEKLKKRITALPRQEQGRYMEELFVITDKLYGLGVRLDDLDNSVKAAESQKESEVGVNCCLCGRQFQPDEAKIRAWAESGRKFEPTDWACGRCMNLPDELYLMEAA